MQQIVIAADQDPAPILDDIIDLADEAGVDIRELPRGRFDQMAATDVPQGVVAFAAPLREYLLEELIAGLSTDGAPAQADGLYRSTGSGQPAPRPASTLLDDPATEDEHTDVPEEVPGPTPGRSGRRVGRRHRSGLCYRHPLLRNRPPPHRA